MQKESDLVMLEIIKEIIINISESIITKSGYTKIEIISPFVNIPFSAMNFISPTPTLT